MALSQPRLMVAPRRSIWFALRKLRPTSEDSNQLSPVGLGSSPWLYIQSEALQGVAAHLGPVESVHLKKIRGTRPWPSRCRRSGLTHLLIVTGALVGVVIAFQ